jgi:hypothetical protein
MRRPITRPWSDDDIALVTRLVADGVSASRCSAVLKRPISSVRVKARSLGLKLMGIRETKAKYSAKLAEAERKLPPGSWRNDGSRV